MELYGILTEEVVEIYDSNPINELATLLHMNTKEGLKSSRAPTGSGTATPTVSSKLPSKMTDILLLLHARLYFISDRYLIPKSINQ